MFLFNNKISAKILFLLLLFIENVSHARAGGAGGGHSGGGGHSSGGFGGGHYSGGYTRSYGSSRVYGSSGASGTFIIFMLIFALIIIYIIIKRSKANYTEASTLPDLPQRSQEQTILSQADSIDFHKKVEIAFLAIQKAWSEKSISIMRRFISDGVYQRFNAQFTMMNLLDQTDIIENIQIKSIGIVNSRIDGLYEIVDVQIFASAEDQFISQKYPVLNSEGGEESFVEIWSFIRRKDHKLGLDIFHSENCPNCAAPLQSQLIETARCSYCGTYLNNGEYDWVLSEITQQDDYQQANEGFTQQILEQREKILASIPDYSKQLIEDRASNAFMQLLIAVANKNIAPLTRFSSANALESMKNMMLVSDFIYDRLFLNSVDLMQTNIINNTCVVKLNIKFSYRHVQIKNQHAFLLDNDLVSEYKLLTLSRELNNSASKGSIYSNTCPNCGAPQSNSLSSICEFCNTAFNNLKHEWIVTDIHS